MSGPRRFALAPGAVQGDRATFDREESRHMVRVLRLRPGDVVVAGDGAGRDYTVRIDELGDTVTGTVIAVGGTDRESPLAITLVQGVPKGDRMELVIRAATELGVVRVVPALTARTVVRLDAARWRERARRWQRVAREATKQCGRAVVPEVVPPRPLAECLEEPGDLRLCLWEGDAPPLAECLSALAGRPRRAAVLVGPEGGLAPEEAAAALARGWRTARLGPRILRTETAGPAIVAILGFRFGDLAGVRADA